MQIVTPASDTAGMTCLKTPVAQSKACSGDTPGRSDRCLGDPNTISDPQVLCRLAERDDVVRGPGADVFVRGRQIEPLRSREQPVEPDDLDARGLRLGAQLRALRRGHISDARRQRERRHLYAFVASRLGGAAHVLERPTLEQLVADRKLHDVLMAVRIPEGYG